MIIMKREDLPTYMRRYASANVTIGFAVLKWTWHDESRANASEQAIIQVKLLRFYNIADCSFQFVIYANIFSWIDIRR